MKQWTAEQNYGQLQIYPTQDFKLNVARMLNCAFRGRCTARQRERGVQMPRQSILPVILDERVFVRTVSFWRECTGAKD